LTVADFDRYTFDFNFPDRAATYVSECPDFSQFRSNRNAAAHGFLSGVLISLSFSMAARHRSPLYERLAVDAREALCGDFDSVARDLDAALASLEEDLGERSPRIFDQEHHIK
jgi:hypothetical protein